MSSYFHCDIKFSYNLYRMRKSLNIVYRLMSNSVYVIDMGVNVIMETNSRKKIKKIDENLLLQSN